MRSQRDRSHSAAPERPPPCHLAECAPLASNERFPACRREARKAGRCLRRRVAVRSGLERCRALYQMQLPRRKTAKQRLPEANAAATYEPEAKPFELESLLCSTTCVRISGKLQPSLAETCARRNLRSAISVPHNVVVATLRQRASPQAPPVT